MILFTVFCTIVFVGLLCSKRFHDWLLELYEKRATRAPNNEKPLISNLPSLPSVRWMIRLGILAGVAWIVYGTLYAIHTQIIPLPMAKAIFSAYDSDPIAWEHNIEKRELGDLGAQHEQWSSAYGEGRSHSRFWQEELWANWPSYLRAGLLLSIVIGGLVIAGWYFTGTKFFPEQPASGVKPADSPKPRYRRVRKKRKISEVNVLSPDKPHSFAKILIPSRTRDKKF